MLIDRMFTAILTSERRNTVGNRSLLQMGKVSRIFKAVVFDDAQVNVCVSPTVIRYGHDSANLILNMRLHLLFTKLQLISSHVRFPLPC